MAIRTRWVCSPAAGAALLLVLLPPTCGCREPAKPSLAVALAARRSAAERTRALVRVALEGGSAERRRAAFLWALHACEAGSPRSALTAFRIAAPVGGRSVLAARRMTGALERTRSGPDLWQAAAGSAWLSATERRNLVVRGAETFLSRADPAAARACIGLLGKVEGPEKGRVLAVRARTGDAEALEELAADFPAIFEAQPQLPTLASITSAFTAKQWKRHAAGWLAAGDARRALSAARRAGRIAALEAAQASLRLRRAREALQWTVQLGESDASRWLAEAEAHRQLAWSAAGSGRRSSFAATVRAAEVARRLGGAGADRGAADLLLAEGLSESGRHLEAAACLLREETRDQPRFEWVWRRSVFLQATESKLEVSAAIAEIGRTTRGRRLAAFWRAMGKSGADRDQALRALAESGHRDLPALWSAARLGASPLRLELRGEEPIPPAPPRWAADLLEVGRTADVVVGWRADLELLGTPSPGWLGLARLAELPPLEAVPLLVRGEPRLPTGQWSGLSRRLLEWYLPLQWRAELERAATLAGVPPWVLAALVRQESAWSPRAISPAGAIGLTQVLPATAEELMRRRRDVFVRTAPLTDPATNLTAGAMLLAQWRKAFAGSWVAGLAAYNAGERRVRAVWERAGRRDGPEFVEALEIPETWDYVHRIVMLAEGYRALYWPEGKAFPWT